ncbi:uncharacterized protein LOC125645871 isoform X2 [Ostrea edulis]|uniref:uncharacterized protein LOC125645871 isoform X2 n=1 Tax=Ostrea edulis TaxID=37623 RepID=UPI0020958F4A|nr:uncharacterized protein LOC125645871 isoform X2 [Ostrea edulis]
MKEKMILCFLIVLLNQCFGEVLSCRASTATISYVSSCPKNKEELEKASRLKNCESIAVIQNCTAPVKFQYHCLMNHWRNATLEVCAPIFYLQGYCAEYNTRVKQVVENYDDGFECLTFPESQRCPTRYASNEAYKYQACYSYNHQQTTTMRAACITEAVRSEDNDVIGLVFIILVLLTFGSIALILVLVKYRRQISDKMFHGRCTSRDNHSSEIKEEEIIGLLHTGKPTSADLHVEGSLPKVNVDEEHLPSLPEEHEGSSNVESVSTTESGPLLDVLEGSSNAELVPTTESEKGTESIDSKSKGQSNKMDKSNEKSGNAQSQQPQPKISSKPTMKMSIEEGHNISSDKKSITKPRKTKRAPDPPPGNITKNKN